MPTENESSQNQLRKNRQAYILNCMFDNGYVLREFSQEERQRRINLIK